MKSSRHDGWTPRLLRGLTSFEARAIALFLLLFFVFPTLSRADTEETSAELFLPNVSVRGGMLQAGVVVSTGHNATVRWILPAGFEPVNGSLESPCPEPGCTANLMVRLNRSLVPGEYDIGVEVSNG